MDDEKEIRKIEELARSESEFDRFRAHVKAKRLLEKMDEERCPDCGEVLKNVVGYDPEHGAFDGVKCPNGCDLRGHY